MTPPAEYWSARRLHVTVEGPQGRSVIPLSHPFARIGRDSGSDIVLANPWVARRSLYLHATEEGVFCFFLQPEETHEQRLGFWLAPGEPLMVGPYRISASLEGDVPGPAPALVPLDDWGGVSPPYPLFQVYSGGVMRDKRRFRARLNLIGRRHECALQIKGQQVSAFHGCLFWQYPRLWYVDLVSSNGSTLNGRSIECAEIRIGDQLEIGEFTLLYQRLSKRGTPRGQGAAAGKSAAHGPADLLPPDFEEDMPLDLDGQVPLQLEEQLAEDEHGGSSPVIPLDAADIPPAASLPAVDITSLAPVQQTRQELATLQRRVEALTQLTAQVGKAAAQQLAQKTQAAFEEERQRIARELERRGEELALEKAALEGQWQVASRELAMQVSQLRDEASQLARQRQAMEQSRLVWDAQRSEIERQLRSYAEQLQRLEQGSGPALPAPGYELPATLPANSEISETNQAAFADRRTPLGLPVRRLSGVQEGIEASALALAAAQRGGAMTPRSHVVDAHVDAAQPAALGLLGLPDSGPRAGVAGSRLANSSVGSTEVLEGFTAAPAAATSAPQQPAVNGNERAAIKGRKPSSKGKEAFDQVTDRLVEMERNRRKMTLIIGIAAGAVVATLAVAMILLAVLLR